MEFRNGYSSKALTAVLIRCGIWSGLNLLLLRFIHHLDHQFLVSETTLSFLTIPVGIINFAVLIYGFNSLRSFSWKTIIIVTACILNFIYFLSIWQSLHILSGSMVNQG